MNRAYDPYHIVKRQMEGGGCNFSIIYFDYHLVLPSSLQHIKSRYYLPDDAQALCRHLLACDATVGISLKSSLESIRDEIRDKRSYAAVELNLHKISSWSDNVLNNVAPDSELF